jgi:4-amino-4-deoxy-L-arabinose transferase-like glycosyltransferase
MRRPVLLTSVFVLATVLRLAVIAPALDRPLVGDEPTYDQIAQNIVAGYGYQGGYSDADRHPTAWRGPSYVLFLAGLYFAFGHGLAAPLLVQVAMELATCLLLLHLARRWFHREAVAITVVAFYAVYPPFIQMAAALLPEALTNLTVVASIAAFQSYLDHRRPRMLAVCALVVALCALNKPQLAPLTVLLPALFLRELGRAQALRVASVLVVAAVIVMAPWFIRNAVVFRTFLPGVSSGGIALWGGSGPINGKTIGGLDHEAVSDSLRTFLGSMDEIEMNRWLTKDALRVIVSDPAAYARLSVRKVFRLWLNVGFDRPPSKASIAVAIFNAVLFLLVFFGARRGQPAPGATRLMLGLVIYWTVIHLPFFTVLRYALPCIALLSIFAAAGLVSLARLRPAADEVGP